MNFSDRYGFTNPRKIIQTRDIDSDLRNAIWNQVYSLFLSNVSGLYWPQVKQPFNTLCSWIWEDFFKQPLDDKPTSTYEFSNLCKDVILKNEWYFVYNFVEFILDAYPLKKTDFPRLFALGMNRVLEKYVAGYRVIDGHVAPIVDEHELASIEKSLTEAPNPVRMHLSSALEKLSNKTAPDYRNSIKESISAVECLCKLLSGKTDATLHDGLAVVEKRYGLPKSLKTAWDRLYSYTSSSQGIRHGHGLDDEATLSAHEAIYFLISCSAFINYLNALGAK